MIGHRIQVGDHVTIVAGKHAGKFAIVDELVGDWSLWCYIMDGPDSGEYATLRASSVVA